MGKTQGGFGVKTLIFILVIALAGCSTTVEVFKDKKTGQMIVKYDSPKDYGEISGNIKYDGQGNVLSVEFKVLDASAGQAKANAAVVKELIGSAERAWVGVPGK
jgi:hypothetical protein